MPPYQPYHYQHVQYPFHNPGGAHVKFPEHAPAGSSDYDYEPTVTEMVIKKVTELTTALQSTIAYTTEGSNDSIASIDEAINAMGVFNGTATGEGGEAVIGRTDAPMINDLIKGTAEPVTQAIEITTNYQGDSIFDKISTTVGNFISEDVDIHNIHQGHVTHEDKTKPYLTLVIVLAVLVVIAAVILFVYLRYKKKAKVCPDPTVVGKTFQPHKLGDKPLAAQSSAGDASYGGCDEGQDIQQQIETKKNKK